MLIDKSERYKGILLGLAVGDAVGTTLEFKLPGTFTPIDNMMGGGPFNLNPGQWTDDTSMALCLAKSLIEKGGHDPTDQMERYVQWYRKGYMSSTGECFDIGNTVQNALICFERTGNPHSGSTNPNSAGNGSIMRLAPVPMFYATEPDKAIIKCGHSSLTTHGTIIAIDACRYFGALLVGALNGASKEELLSPMYTPISKYWVNHPLQEDITYIANGSFKEHQPPDICGSGYVIKSLEAALWAFYQSSSFREGCLLAVNLGNDADTTGAIYGQLAGAFYGKSEIPIEWQMKLAKRKLLESLAIDLLKRSLSS